MRNSKFILLSLEYHCDIPDGTYTVLIRPSSFVSKGTIPVLIDSLSRYEDRYLVTGSCEGEKISLLLDERPKGSALFVGVLEEKVLLFDQSGKRVRKKIFL